MEFNYDNPLQQEAFEKFFNVETESMAADGYAQSKEAILRKVALNVILENSKCSNFDAFIPYLAMNYFDRFISRNQLPNVLGLVRNDIVLAAICCLTIAWKVRDQAFRFRYLMNDRNLNEDYKNHILNMELQILNGLKWRMRAVTAIYFEEFFVEKTPVGKCIERRTLNEIIIEAQGDIYFTQFKPSVIAASALLAACRLLYPNEYNGCKKDLLACRYITEEELEPCVKNTYEMCIDKHILPERNEKFKLGPHQPVQAGETSSLMLSKDPLQNIPKIKETISKPEPSSSSSSSLHRSGKETMQEVLEMQEESERETDPSLFSHRPGKQPMLEISEEKEPAKTDNEPGLSFELKWRLRSSENPEDITIDSPLFRSTGPVLDPNIGTNMTQARQDSTCSPQCISCSLM